METTVNHVPTELVKNDPKNVLQDVEINTLDDMFSIHKWLEAKILVANEAFENIALTNMEKREHQKVICEAVWEIKKLCDSEKVKKGVYFKLVEEAFNGRISKDQRSKALKFGGYADKCIKYVESINSDATSIDRMVFLYEKSMRETKNAERITYDKSVLSRDFGYNQKTKPLTNKDVYTRIVGGNEAFLSNHSLLTVDQLNIIEGQYETNMGIIREVTALKKAA